MADALPTLEGGAKLPLSRPPTRDGGAAEARRDIWGRRSSSSSSSDEGPAMVMFGAVVSSALGAGADGLGVALSSSLEDEESDFTTARFALAGGLEEGLGLEPPRLLPFALGGSGSDSSSSSAGVGASSSSDEEAWAGSEGADFFDDLAAGLDL